MNGVARARSGTAAATVASVSTAASVVPAPTHTVAVATLDALELVEPADVDQVLEDGEAQREHRHEALATGEDFGAVAQLRQQLGRGGGALRSVVLERRRLHGRRPYSAAARTFIGRSMSCGGTHGSMNVGSTD